MSESERAPQPTPAVSRQGSGLELNTFENAAVPSISLQTIQF
jgi:hypothetical protein